MCLDVPPDPEWSFANRTRKETSYATHGYHRYPAKFIPHLSRKLLEMYTEEGQLILDPFVGCGTTLVEAKIHGRKSIGFDINPVAVMITSAKIQPMEHKFLVRNVNGFVNKLINCSHLSKGQYVSHDGRIVYWFPREDQRGHLGYIYKSIDGLPTEELKVFMKCGFSNILKNCSIWLQKSNKPTRDFDKKLVDPYKAIKRQSKAMVKGNKEFCEILNESGHYYTSAEVDLADARDLPVDDSHVDCIITSPPYVTSYEYADMHQLTALWLKYTNDISEFRKPFIGSVHVGNVESESHYSETAAKIISDMPDKRITNEMKQYFNDMYLCFCEMYRVLKSGGRACIVIGDTTLRKVHINNPKVFVEQLKHIGFDIDKIIKREIPIRILPKTRDKTTGKFAKVDSDNLTFSYPTEYILVAKKP